MASKYIKRFKVPNNFENILSDFAKEILRNQPKDIIQFGIEYFKGLETNAKFDFKDKGENRPENYKRPENKEPNIISAPNNLEISQEDKNRLQRSMDKIERINKDPEPVPEKKEEFETGRHVAKYEQQESTYTRKVMTEEVHVSKQVTVISKEKVIRNGEVIKDETHVEKLVSGDNGDGGRYAGVNSDSNEQHKKDYDDWFTKHSMDKQEIQYKRKEEKLDENLKRNEMGYNTWFKNHSMGSMDQSQSGELQNNEEGTKLEYGEWFSKHSKDRMAIDYKRPKGKAEESVARCQVDYPTWFENHSKLTNKEA
jgi:hypothetical protein